MVPPEGIDLEQYRTRAKELLRLARTADPNAIKRIRAHHPERDFVATSASVKLADAQLVVARELGFASWPKLKEYLLFRNAIRFLDRGDVERLSQTVREHPAVLAYRCRIGDWYESGYFQGATLLNHIAGNPIRCPLPSTIIEMTRTLLSLGADPNIATETGSTTIGLLLTGKQVADAGVAVTLVDMLKAAGAVDDIDHSDLLSAPLWNAARTTAEALAKRGARIELRHAAALGRVADVARMLAAKPSRDEIEEALIFASHQGELETARMLVENGAAGDVMVTSHRSTPDYAGRATALHMAANAGHSDIVKLLLAHGAHATAIEPTFGGTAIGWARHGGYLDVAELLERDLVDHGLAG